MHTRSFGPGASPLPREITTTKQNRRFSIQIGLLNAKLCLAKTSEKPRVYSVVEDKYVCRSQVFWGAAGGILGSLVHRLASYAARHVLMLESSGL